MPELSTIYDYMRTNANLLGARILEQFPALHQVHDALSPPIEGLLRKPFPAQAIAIMGLAKRWQQARTGMVVAECGTGKTLISLGAIHVHSGGRAFTALAMVPPHLVEKWAREAFFTLPCVRVFFIDDLRNGGDENKFHGVNEVRLRQGRISPSARRLPSRVRSARKPCIRPSMWRTRTWSAVSGIVWNGAAQASMAGSSLNQKCPNIRHFIETTYSH